MSDVLIPPSWPTPFRGITVEQARILNSAVWHLPVAISTASDRRRESYLFEGIAVPGMRTDPFIQAGDLTLLHRRPDGLPVHGLRRIISASIVRSFTVLAGGREYRTCESCGAALLRDEKVYDVASLGSAKLPPGTYGHPDGPFEWDHRFECRACWYGDGL